MVFLTVVRNLNYRISLLQLSTQSVPNIMPSATGGCVVCGEPGLVCKGCQRTRYCSREHQKQDWEQHRPHCGHPFEVRTNPTLGRHLVATRHIPEGEVILREGPLVFGPHNGESALGDGSLVTSCTSCCRILDPDPSVWVRCSRCQWPMCSATCQDSPVHLPECSLLAERQVWSGSTSEISVAELDAAMIFIVRCLLANKKTASKIRELQGNCGNSLDKTQLEKEVEENQFKAVLNVVEMLKISPDDVRRVSGIVSTNVFQMYSGYGKVRGCALYYLASFMSHSCMANAEWALSNERSMEIIVRAMKSICPGEVISTIYVPLNVTTSTRNALLLRDHGFECYCQRCCDPTELGSFIASICCEECKRENGQMGLLVGVSSSPNDNYFEEWRCQECQTIVPAEVVHVYHDCAENMTVGVDNDTKVKILLFPKGRLHPGNSIILHCKFKIVGKIIANLRSSRNSIAGREFSPSTEDLRRVVSLCREILAGYVNVIPHLSQTTGMIQLDMHTAMAELVRRKMHRFMSSRMTIVVFAEGSKEILKDIEAVKVELEKAENILKHLADFRDELKKLRLDFFVMRRVWVWTSAALQFCDLNYGLRLAKMRPSRVQWPHLSLSTTITDLFFSSLRQMLL